MKSEHRLVIATATAVVAIFTTSASAQYRALSDDGIAASPKLREQLNQHSRQELHFASVEQPPSRSCSNQTEDSAPQNL